MEDPRERRERLKRLREEAKGEENDGSTNKDKASDFADLRFRNYKPRNEAIGERKIVAAKPRELTEPAPSTLADALKDEQTALDAFVPKKPHLDLKKDLTKPLRKLERATIRALGELRVELELQDGS